MHAQPSPRILGVVGHSGSGKTTLLEALVPRLRSLGHRVGVLKHDAHRLELDKRGKDSFRLRETGAEVVAIASGHMVFLSAPPPREPSVDAMVRAHFSGLDLDLVLVEGFTAHPHPKVEVLHPTRPPRADPFRDDVRAWVARDERVVGGPPCFLAREADSLLASLARGGCLPGAVRLASVSRACRPPAA